MEQILMDSRQWVVDIGLIDEHLEVFRSSTHPWRGEYIGQIINQIEGLISRGCCETANILLERLEKQIKQWAGNNQCLVHKHDKGLSGKDDAAKDIKDKDIDIKDIIDSLQTRLTEYCRLYREDSSMGSGDKDPLGLQDLWKRYRHLSEEEIEKWDALCLRLIRRIKFLEQLDFSDEFKGKWGPYNRRHNIMQVLRYLNHYDPEWLENYLLLYASLQQFEQNLRRNTKEDVL